MKVRYIIAAEDGKGNTYSTMEEFFGFRTSEECIYVICAEGTCLIQYDVYGSVTDCFRDGCGFEMPNFQLSISDFMEKLREQDVLFEGETVTDVYTEDQINVKVEIEGE